VIGYVVESPVEGQNGRIGTARVYVATEERAREIAAAHPPGRATVRALDYADMPPAARDNLERAGR
jgi:hypothetical protein